MLNLQLGATLSQLSGDPAQALELLKALKVSLRYWLTGLEVEMADIASLRGETTGNFHELQTVLHTLPDFDDLDHEIILSTFGLEAQAKGVVESDSSISKNPFITIKAAEMQAATGEMDTCPGNRPPGGSSTFKTGAGLGRPVLPQVYSFLGPNFICANPAGTGPDLRGFTLCIGNLKSSARQMRN